MESDRISSLLDSLLAHIVSYLPIEDSIKTSVLSKRWELVWLNASVLDLKKSVFPPDNNKVPEMVMNKFLKFNRRLHMHTFKVKYDDHNICTFQYLVWIDIMINRGIQHLDVETNNSHDHIHYMPKNIYKSKTLVCLKLTNVGITDNHQELVVSLPCLKIMYLEDIFLDKDGPLITEKLILGCPVLEDLNLLRGQYLDDDVQNLPLLRVKSQTLKIFRLTFN
ncbi:F-box/FBD/LRR-repeat protein [Cardamine amara subsp. amara]|uniref:F-box/FBD/LRR-repeat protein n=1 Tax=Cardamine amara subsp. amara TaxID=228776 RepID=A0ABD0ZCV4_CARAN